MGTYGLEGVIRAWEQEQLTTEQTIGQILLLLQELKDQLSSLERRIEWYRERMHHLRQ